MAKGVLILIDNGFEDTEALYPYYRMQEAGLRVAVAGSPHGEYKSKHGYPLRADKSARAVTVSNYSAVIIPGGLAPDRLRTRPEMVRIVREAVKKGLVVAAICHGPQLLIEADVLRGRRTTCYESIKTDVVNAGGMYEDSPVVVDGNLITSRRPGDLPEFCRTILEMLG
ncbi:MAG: type 1 glutamine amidotransferase domain-containing protein [Thermodesulfobacteriota bacterium]